MAHLVAPVVVGVVRVGKGDDPTTLHPRLRPVRGPAMDHEGVADYAIGKALKPASEAAFVVDGSLVAKCRGFWRRGQLRWRRRTTGHASDEDHRQCAHGPD